MTKVEIRYPRFEYIFGRNVAQGQLYDVKSETMISQGSIAALLSIVYDEDYELVNAQEILDLIVRQNGFSA
jgi:hypothetical protein